MLRRLWYNVNTISNVRIRLIALRIPVPGAATAGRTGFASYPTYSFFLFFYVLAAFYSAHVQVPTPRNFFLPFFRAGAFESTEH
jgi:hypothetical protein